MIEINEQLKIIKKGAAEIISEEDIVKKLEKSAKENKPLTIKLGLDPSAPDIHLGHTVVLRKMKAFQDLGHQVVIIIGDATGMIGDPTGKSAVRKQLSHEQVLENARTYQEQIFKILDREKTIVKFNSEWLQTMNFMDVANLASKYTVARMLERDDFKKRFASNQSISIHEFFYPLMQGYDSVAIKADIEMGGTDQKFNILMGRTLQKEYDQEPQIALLMPIIEGTDGVKKMSKSLGNYIGISEAPNDMYGKTMSIPDELIIRYFELVTDEHPDSIEAMKSDIEQDKVNPRDLKMKLAKEVVKLYHGEEKALEAEQYFKSVFQKKNIPDDIAEMEVSIEECEEGLFFIPKIVTGLKLSPSTSEARRLLKQGGIKLNGEKVENDKIALETGDIIQVGKRKFAKIIINK
ncbi:MULTISPECIES: tyrosine--tRNA ligase [Paraclostridium]|uniref:Tyrosine--tRNA ligase n=1 Tax=Paraclostridium bifermentans TaxID=1490 RepID=A0AA44DMB3_PARBF|nr:MULTISPECIES: tyrosine--tRNA ligase [Paraclostridium]EQK48146.1 tyrosine--tRNA ligase [[Clostridium] bifermentans ATCC 19299] [Paraclostridium bifermentans ATCC 19299]MBN8048653.1 tyrosine--tRNA ligase [Paraclostridium bifermentans]MBZ6005868.1 tyrosine--tRNA ligase [Paraclostridium bifermentans]MCE9676182.1 tyrosine--tRNA ligase [Paraclostridium bifermentans]MCR1876682.1 tyrosine--tRNA ligase [Paraclostridium bifermentans]